MKNSYEDFKNECALSNEEIQELTDRYLNSNDKNVKDLLDELYLVIYNVAYENNIGKNIVDYSFDNCFLCNRDIDNLSNKYLKENETSNGSYAFISVAQIRMVEKRNKKSLKKIRCNF